MDNILHAEFEGTGASTSANAMGMRAMQERVYAARDSQYLLVKAPPASGKSRALMFVALHKLAHQGLRQVIVTVPERTIGTSFRSTNLTAGGFFADWAVDPKWNLCTDELDTDAVLNSKAETFEAFLNSTDTALVCTHTTFRRAYEILGAEAFDNRLVAIDEFHHTSAHEENRLGEMVRGLIERDALHIMAMTGSYFRGDAILVLRPEDEARFDSVTYTYFEQLNGYEHLKSLGIGYHFFEGRYTSAIGAILDTTKKTIIHIPYVGSVSSEGNKYDEVGRILDVIGTHNGVDAATGFHLVTTEDGRQLKVADLVEDDPAKRLKVAASLRDISSRDDIDIIIALGMAKEGFDWVWCEHALTVGYRSSLTEIVQIIGRATRDAEGKPHAQFTNLIPEPDATQDNVTDAVNELLKAISASLLMEQVLAPNFNFFNSTTGGEDGRGGTGTISIGVKDLKDPPSERARSIIENHMAELIHEICTDQTVREHATFDPDITAEEINKVLVPRVIEARFPDLEEDEIEAIRQQAVLNMNLKSRVSTEGNGNYKAGDGAGSFFALVRKFIKVDELSMDLIDRVNPFQSKYEVIAKDLDAPMLSRIHEIIANKRIPVTEEEAISNWGRIQTFKAEHGRWPTTFETDPANKRLGEIYAWIKEKKRQSMRESAKDGG